MDPPSLTDLPLELVRQIAGADRTVYHPMVLAYPAFARSLTLGDRLDYAEAFGYDCHVVGYNNNKKSKSITWTLNGKIHRTDGPAEVFEDGSLMWCINNQNHRLNGPAWINNFRGKCHHNCVANYLIDPQFSVCAAISISYHIHNKHYYETEYHKKVAQIRGQ